MKIIKMNYTQHIKSRNIFCVFAKRYLYYMSENRFSHGMRNLKYVYKTYIEYLYNENF